MPLRSQHFPAPGTALILTVGAAIGGVVFSPETVFACDSIVISVVDIDRCVVPGDQADIDEGNVVRVDRLSSETVHWLAGHRTTHGATFRDLTGLQLDDLVAYRGLQYRVVEYRLVDRYQPGDVAAWSLATTPSVVLQTSYNNTSVHVWRAVEIAPVTQLQQSAPVPPARTETNQSTADSATPATTRVAVRVRGSRLVMFS